MEGSVKQAIGIYGGDSYSGTAKRVLDVALSALALAVLWPFLLVLCLLIPLDSPGAGPIFVQTRVGKNAKPFRMYKFRTMVPRAEALRPGLLGKNEMDELPQLINVLKGEMSLVGPRPGLPEEVAEYDAFAAQRLTVLPGITCYWQVQPDRNTLRFREWMELDIRYIRDRSLRTDVKILLATVKALRRMDGQ